MRAARSAHAHRRAGMPIARRQIDLPPGLQKDKKPKNPNRPPDPPGMSDNTSTPPPPVPDTVSPTPPAKPTPAANYEEGDDTTTTSTSVRYQTRTTSTSSLSPSPSRNPNQGTTGYGPVSYAGVANAGSGPSGSDNGGFSSDLNSVTVTSTPDSSPPTPDATAGTLNSEKRSTAKGSIAAAVIVSLLFLIAIVVFILRRRSKARRDEQAIKWGFTQNRTSQSYGDDEHFSFRNSNRSSFATTFDHSSMAVIPPPPPPMAVVGRPDGTAPALIMDTNADQKRFSIGSAHSDNSQYLVVHHRESSQPENWPSVTECTESFPFPKPPLADSSSLHSRTSEGSRTAFPKIEEPEVLYVASPLGNKPTTPFLPIMQPTQPSLLLTNPFADNNPFDDPTPLPVPLTEASFQTVRRPFFPQLQDEMQVIIGDSVRIVQIFDDGWALVEKVPSTPQSDRGLIPLECLRDPVGPNLLMAGGRISSHSAKKA